MSPVRGILRGSERRKSAEEATMNRSTKHALVVSFLALAPALLAATVKNPPPQPRRPRGIYADVNVEEIINLNGWKGDSPKQLASNFKGFFDDLLANQAVSGIVLYETWARLNPNPPAPIKSASESPQGIQDPQSMAKIVGPTPLEPYDWSLTDAAFAEAAAWNGKHKSQAQKTIQLVVTPGINSPSWITGNIASCDFMFNSSLPVPKSPCGMVTFYGFVEGGNPKSGPITQVMPMPWDSFYKSSWQTFLTALASKYEPNPLFVSIAVAGPTASSEEIMVPNDGDTPTQTQFGTPISPDDVWLALLKSQYGAAPVPISSPYPGLTYENSDQAFIDEWENAIDMYAKIFSGITLSVSTGRSLPELCMVSGNPCPFTGPSSLSADCPTPNMDCAAETAIVAYFAEAANGGANAKAVQEDGLKGRKVGPKADLGVASVKIVSAATQFDPAPSQQILGGAQFARSFSSPNTMADEGCVTDPMCTITPEQAAWNVLNRYFDGTPVATSFDGTMGAATFNYLQIYAPDFDYAKMNATAPPVKVLETDPSGKKGTVSWTAQDLLNQASEKLLGIAEPTVP
jgi:hypothetical protein